MERILKQIDDALQEWQIYSEEALRSEESDYPEMRAISITNRLASAITRLAPRGSVYIRNVEDVLKQSAHPYYYQTPLAGILTSLRQEYKLGYMRTVEELIHGDTFSSFLEMAEHLESIGYKDAAAVIVGSTLEQHLRELCIRNEVDIEVDGKPKKIDGLNDDLRKKGIYSKNELKNVTSWLALRNSAAHGEYDEYTTQQVALFISSVRDFITRHPA